MPPGMASSSGPATSTGLDAAFSRAASSRTVSGSAAARPLTLRDVQWPAACSSTSAAQSSKGIDTNAGPRGGSIA